MKPATIKYVKDIDAIVSGSFISKSKNPRKAMKELKKAAK
jgi:3-keto-L-gulonate-6-phosphate decarboxylase